MKSEKWYATRLLAFCVENYSEYEDSMEWYVNPAPNQWKFRIPELDKTCLITCDDNGIVKEEIL